MQTTIARLTNLWDSRGRDRMVFGYKLPVQSVPKVYQGLATGRWFSPGTPVSSTNKN